MYEMAQKVREAGGDPQGSNSKILKDYVAQMEKQTEALQKSELALRGINDKMNPAAVAVVPPGGANAGPAH
jgi:hypothetical protein